MKELLATIDSFTITLTGGFAIYGAVCILFATGYLFHELCKPLGKMRSKTKKTPENESE